MANQASRTLKLKFDGDSTGLAQASKDAGATLDKFNKTTEKTASRMEGVSKRSEDLADNSSLATGALGALASGFELVGLEGYAERLQQASLATDFMSGVGDTLTLVTDRLGLSTLAAKAATVRQTVASKAATVATKAQAVAQRALNLVMRANPTVLILTAIVGALVLAYKKSETFRRIVRGAFNGVKRAAEAVWKWIRRYFPPLFDSIKRPFERGASYVRTAFGWVRDAAGRAVGWVRDRFSGLVSFFGRMPSRIGRAASGMWDGIKNSFRGAINAVIGWWNNLEFKINVPDILPGPDSYTIRTPNFGYLAAGGYGAPGRWYLTGEYGPELIRFGSGGGHVTPNNKLEGSSSLGDAELRSMAGRLLELLSELMAGEIREGNRRLRRRAGQLSAVTL